MKRTYSWTIALFAALASIGVVQYRAAHAQGEITGAVPYQGQNVNRFQVFYCPTARADTYLVDTLNGQIWQSQLSAAGATVFAPVNINPHPVVPPGSAAGRFVIYFSPLAEADQFLVDTATGRTWQQFADPTSHQAYFSEVVVQGLAKHAVQ